MAEDPNDLSQLDISDADAEKLLADPADDAPQDKPDPADPLGEAGKKAIDTMKRERNAARTELAKVQAQLKSIDDKDKTELQRLQEERDALKASADKAGSQARAMQVAMDRAPAHATLAQVKAVAKRVRGDSDDELDADADELFELLAPPKDEPTPSSKTSSRPQERLRGGAEPDDEPGPTDPRALANLIPRRS